MAMATFNQAAPLGAIAVGIAGAALECSTNTRSRATFGEPIAIISRSVHDCRDGHRHEAVRLLTYQAALNLDPGDRNTQQSSPATPSPTRPTARCVTTDAVQVFGGNGYGKEYPVEKLMRDAKILQIDEGTSQVQRLVMAREILMPRHIEEPAVDRQLAAAA